MHAAVGTSVGRADTVRKLLAQQRSHPKLYKAGSEKKDLGNQSSQHFGRDGSNSELDRDTALHADSGIRGHAKDNRWVKDQNSFGPSTRDIAGNASNVDNRPSSQPPSFSEERLRSFRYRNLSRKMLQNTSRALLPAQAGASSRNLIAPSEKDTGAQQNPSGEASHFTPAFPHAATSSSRKLLGEKRIQSDLPTIPSTPESRDAEMPTEPARSESYPPVRATLWQILEPAGGSLSKRRGGALHAVVIAWTAVIFSLILLSISALVAESLPAYCCGRMDGTWNAIEQICVAVFTLEFVARFLLCPTAPAADGAQTVGGAVVSKLRFLASASNAIDLLAILPYYVLLVCSIVAPGAVGRQLRILKVLRVLRLLKVLRYFSADLRQIGDVFRRSVSLLTTTYTLIFTVFLVIASIMYLIERGTWCDASNNYCGGSAADGPGWYGDLQSFAEIPDIRRTSPSARVRSDFKSIFAALWYGDVVPRTMWGRLFGSIALFLGMNMIALPITIFSSMFEEAFLEEVDAENGDMNECEEEDEVEIAKSDEGEDEQDRLAALAAAAAAFANVEGRPFARARPSESSDWHYQLECRSDEDSAVRADSVPESGFTAVQGNAAGAAVLNCSKTVLATSTGWDGESCGEEQGQWLKGSILSKKGMLPNGSEDSAAQGPGTGQSEQAELEEEIGGSCITTAAIRRLYEEHETALMQSLKELIVRSTRDIVHVVLEEIANWQGVEAASAVADFLDDDSLFLPKAVHDTSAATAVLLSSGIADDSDKSLLEHLVAEISDLADFPVKPADDTSTVVDDGPRSSSQ